MVVCWLPCFCSNRLHDCGEGGGKASPSGRPDGTAPASAGCGAGPIDVPGARGPFARCPGEIGVTPLGDRGGVGGPSGAGDGGLGPAPKGGTSLGAALPRGGVSPNALSSKRSRLRGPFVLSAISSMAGRGSPSENPVR